MQLSANGLTFSAATAGPADGPSVLLLHGFPDHAGTFRHQMNPLADAGFRVIAPTMRGYEPGSQPAGGDYSLMALVGDVVGWLDDVGVERAHLVGHDWGAAVAYVAAAHHGDRFHTVTALAIPPVTAIPSAVAKVPRQSLLSWYMTFFQIPKVAEWSLDAGDRRFVRWLWQRWSPGYTMSPDEWAEVDAVFGRPGVVEAALAYYRHNATPALHLGLRSNDAMSAARIGVPTLIINGRDDGCMDPRMFDRCVDPSDYPAGVSHETLDGVGHFLHLEDPERVNRLLLNHLGHSE